ncbi:DNA/RNA non-specific endonuclease [Alistipes megaguti]|uniref:DNA/RNA non-specific endonuclease n=1 Tax=Alistipes megaguti TaxID=2364787 RepID=UPI003B58CD0A
MLLLTFFTACGGDDGAEDGTYAVVEAASFTFNENDPTKNVIQVLANTEWTVYWTPETSGVSVSPATGSGNGSFYVADMPAGQTLKFGVKTASGKTASQFVTVTRTSGPGGDDGDDGGDTPAGETVFSLDFGDGTGGIWADTNEEWKTQSGTGASTVSYNTSRMRINNDNFGSSGRYAGASGKAYAKIFTDGDPGYFTIRDITLPAGQTAYTLSFGTIFPEGDMNLEVSADGSSWKRLTYKGASAYNTWTKASVGFTLTDAVPSLSIRYSVTGVQREYGLSFDDIVLTTGGGGQQIDFGASGKEYRWAELPATPADMTNRKIYTFWSTTVSTKQHLRNYTYCYDTKRHCPLWIAHPQHACYEEGGRTRPETQPWAADPNMTQAEQAIIWVWPGDNRDKYVVSESPLYRWGRGHMLASGYRGCGDANNPAEINVQTFYSCNIAPQGGEVFSDLWQQAEWRIQDYYVCADTLYCVSGAHFGEGAIAAHDGSWVNQNAQVRGSIDEAKPCEVPTHYYKLILRTRAGNTRKAIQECSASELKAVGFWFENGDGTDDSNATIPTLGAAQMKSVKWIEEQTGFTFFPDVPDEVKEQCNPSDWGF